MKAGVLEETVLKSGAAVIKIFHLVRSGGEESARYIKNK